MLCNFLIFEVVWCEVCEKEFKNENVYKGYLNGWKYIKVVEILVKWEEIVVVGDSYVFVVLVYCLRECVVVEREFRVRKFISVMSIEKDDICVNVEWW